jgi:hypothetical protein
MNRDFEKFLKRGFDRQPSPDVPSEDIRERVLNGRGPADPQDAALSRPSSWPARVLRSHPRLVAFSSFAALTLLAFTGIILASANSLPGDPLYAVKRQVETARLNLQPSFDLYAELARERARELIRLDRQTSLDSTQARTLIDDLNAQLTQAQALAPDDRLEKLSEETFDCVVPVLDAHQFAAEDSTFPMPMLFRKNKGLLKGELQIPTFNFEPTLRAQDGALYLFVGGKIYTIDPRTMKILKE